MNPSASGAPDLVTAGRILIADPDDTVRMEYRRAFALGTFEVVETSDGRDALVQACMTPPSALITELRLPVMDGFALCQELRQDRLTSSVPLVVVTDEHDGTALARARRIADTVLIKPTGLDVLLAEVRDLIARSTAMRIEARQLATRARAAMARSSQLVRRHSRYFTSTPPIPPPELACPSCSTLLQYEQSFIGGVNSRLQEQWDYYICPRETIRFQYRERTRQLRRTHPD